MKSFTIGMLALVSLRVRESTAVTADLGAGRRVPLAGPTSPGVAPTAQSLQPARR
jgi:hypothetical protein